MKNYFQHIKKILFNYNLNQNCTTIASGLTLLMSAIGVICFIEQQSFSYIPHLAIMITSTVFFVKSRLNQINKIDDALKKYNSNWYPLFKYIHYHQKSITVNKELSDQLQQVYLQKEFEAPYLVCDNEKYYMLYANNENTKDYVVIVKVDANKQLTAFSNHDNQHTDIFEKCIKSCYPTTFTALTANVSSRLENNIINVTMNSIKENTALSKKEILNIAYSQLKADIEKEEQLISEKEIVNNEISDTDTPITKDNVDLQKDAQHALKFLDIKYFNGQLHLTNHRDSSQI